MWDKLPEEKKKEYRRMVLGYAALTPVFSQKATTDTAVYTPIINSKYQETVFQMVFDATVEDIGNTSYDASLIVNENGRGIKCLVGIKTFGYGSSLQKVAQFKSVKSLSKYDSEIEANARGENGVERSSAEINLLNFNYYDELAKRISSIRNERIESSKAKLRGFNIDKNETPESVYHVLMPTIEDGEPKIKVGETTYNKIDIDNIEILGCTTSKTPMNFRFRDGHHTYNYTSADHQLLMDFSNSDIVKETWDVKYAEDAYEIMGKISDSVYGEQYQVGDMLVEKQPIVENLTSESGLYGYDGGRIGDDFVFARAVPADIGEEPIDYMAYFSKKTQINESYSWPLINEDGKVELFSGLNQFFGVGSKISISSGGREGVIRKIEDDFKQKIDKAVLSSVSERLERYFFIPAKSYKEKIGKVRLRQEILVSAEETGDDDFMKRLEKILFRPMNELYIPIPNSRKFHEAHPDFFAKGAGEFKSGTSKLRRTPEERCFNLVFEPSGKGIRSFITQDWGKAIESYKKQSYLGEWILREVFQLKEREPLTVDKLYEVEINGIQVYRTDADNDVHIRFIWDDGFC